MPSKTLDARGKSCPMPIVALAKEARVLAKGDELVVLSDDNAFPADVTAWCNKTGHKLLSLDRQNDHHRAVIRKEA